MRLLALAAVGVTLAAAAVDSQGPIAVGVMTRTGFLLPFFQINGNLIIPLTTKGDMLPEGTAFERAPWTLTTIEDGSTAELRVIGKLQLDLGYEFREAWTTTFKGKP